MVSNPYALTHSNGVCRWTVRLYRMHCIVLARGLSTDDHSPMTRSNYCTAVLSPPIHSLTIYILYTYLLWYVCVLYLMQLVVFSGFRFCFIFSHLLSAPLRVCVGYYWHYAVRAPFTCELLLWSHLVHRGLCIWMNELCARLSHVEYKTSNNNVLQCVRAHMSVCVLLTDSAHWRLHTHTHKKTPAYTRSERGKWLARSIHCTRCYELVFYAE